MGFAISHWGRLLSCPREDVAQRGLCKHTAPVERVGECLGSVTMYIATSTTVAHHSCLPQHATPGRTYHCPPMAHDAAMAEFVFEEPLDKDHECPICLDVQREAHLTKCCGNHFCFLCIARVMRDSSKHCPVCNAAPPLEIFPNKDRQRKIMSLRVGCQYVLCRASPRTSGSDTRCAWRGELRDFETHQHYEDESTEAPPEDQQLQREACGGEYQAAVGGSATGYRRMSSQEYEDEVALLKAVLKQNSGPLTGSASAVDGMAEDLFRLTLAQSAGNQVTHPNQILTIPQRYIDNNRGGAGVSQASQLCQRNLRIKTKVPKRRSVSSTKVAPQPRTCRQVSDGLVQQSKNVGEVQLAHTSRSSTNVISTVYGYDPKFQKTREKITGATRIATPPIARDRRSTPTNRVASTSVASQTMRKCKGVIISADKSNVSAIAPGVLCPNYPVPSRRRSCHPHHLPSPLNPLHPDHNRVLRNKPCLRPPQNPHHHPHHHYPRHPPHHCHHRPPHHHPH